jgi:hypothetical protein
LHAIALDEAQLRRFRRIEQRSLGAGSDAGLAQRAGVLVDAQRAKRRARGERNLVRRSRRVCRKVL